MNARTYQGIAPRQTAAMRQEKVLRAMLGPTAYAAHQADREAYYRDLIRKAHAKKAL